MVISKTPLRISFFGGGTDYKVWFENHGGVVLSTTIDKYIYVTLRHLPPFFKHKSRIVWSLIETVSDNGKIENPAVRECLKFMKIKNGVEVHYDADLPARTGLGSSSAFTAGLLKSIYAHKQKMVSKRMLAMDVIHVEQDMIGDNVGWQDQVAAVYGGMNVIFFRKKGRFTVEPLTVSTRKKALLKKHLLLYFTGFSRLASNIAGEVIKNVKIKEKQFHEISQMVGEACEILTGPRRSMADFGKLLHEAWMLKSSLAKGVSIPAVDEIYSSARKAGATGGKLLGAGGGGFMLLFAPPERHPEIKRRLSGYLHVPFQFENLGSQVIFYNPEGEHR